MRIDAGAVTRAAVVLCALVSLVGGLDCSWDSPTGKLAFTGYGCPGNATCVISAARGESSTQHMFLPLGCCPADLPTPVTTNTTTYTKMHGCCPAGQVGCVSGTPGNRYLMGCATDVAQCCHDRICPDDYKCCVSELGIACCPRTTMCRASDYFVPIEANGYNSLQARVSSFFDTPDDHHCVPAYMTTNFSLTTAGDGTPLPFPLEVVTYPSNATYETFNYYVVNVTRTPDVFDCGAVMCYDGDMCVNRYRNVSKPRVIRAAGMFGCAEAKMTDQSAWDAGCFRLDHAVEEAVHPAGCCPMDTTPCGAHDHTFTPYEINAHSSPVLYEPVFACARANETCCYPFLCPPGAKCCTARRQVNGMDINVTTLAESLGPLLLATANEGHNYCCPDDATCCEYIPEAAASENASRRPKAIPFCGTDDTCRRDYYSNNRKLYPATAVREAIPFTGDHFTDGYAHRTALGIVGNTTYYAASDSIVDGSCYYLIDVNGAQVEPFTITCSVLNGNECAASPAGLCFAQNVAPFDQIALELILEAGIPCPSPTPHPWCISP